MVLISLRGDGPWRGKTTRQLQDRGGRFQIKILNGYVGGDGHEIRSIPGWTTLVDLTYENNPTYGFRRVVIDAVRPTWQTNDGFYFPYGHSPVSTSMQTMRSTADELHIHCFEQVRDKIHLIGEAGFRKNPIYSNDRVAITITTVKIINGNWQVGASAVVGSFSATDTSPSLNGLAAGDIVYVEDVTIVTPAPAGTQITQAEIDATLNGRFHAVQDASILRLLTSTSATGTGTMGVTGKIWRTKNNVSNAYSSPNPISPWEPSVYNRIDDPPALTDWVVNERPVPGSGAASLKCVPSFVANRQRDIGDLQSANPSEGVKVYNAGTTFRGWSRRQQKPLPFRVNPEVAGDRIVLAAPSYMCLFQIPVMVPVETEDWPLVPSTWTRDSGHGVRWWGNDIYDKPRCLGIPKAILLDSLYANPPSPVGSEPSPLTYPYNFNMYLIAGGAAVGFGAGVYKIAISYVDEVTGEEGLASEPITFTVPAGNTRGIYINYLNPGYVMPECLARRINIYIAPPGSEQMGLYWSTSLQESVDLDAAYGNLAGQSPESNLSKIWRFILLPVFSTTDLTRYIDFTRLAPQSGLQPRGGEAVRSVGGILFSVGHSGSHGNVGEILRSNASVFWSDATNPRQSLSPDEVVVQAFCTDILQSGTPDITSTQWTDGPFGIGGNFFPAAYQGIEMYSQGLLPIPVQRWIVDRVKNNATYNTQADGIYANRKVTHRQRLAILDSGLLPSPGGTLDRVGREVELLLPRGQVQVGDPGRPGAVSATAIQFMDSKKDDDGVALGQFGDALIICSKNETYQLSWFRTPQGQVPKVLSTEFGCVATNSMVAFDGGLAWMSARGPCAMGDGVQWIGEQLEHDFTGTMKRYRFDSKGMMRHCFGAHDESRGLIYWGLITEDSTHEINYKGVTATYVGFSNYATRDEARSRFPCDEILIWSYKANAFSTWRPPAGLEVLWMRPMRINDGSTRMCFLAADKRIYAFDDAYSDTNPDCFVTAASENGSESITLEIDDTFGIDGDGGAASRGNGTLLREGMTVVCVRADKVVWTTTVDALVVATQTITLADAQDWEKGDRIEVGVRPALEIQMGYTGDAPDNLPIKCVQLRYTLHGEGAAHVDASATTTDLTSEEPATPGFTESPRYQPLAAVSTGSAFDRIGQRRILEEGFAIGNETSLSLTFLGRPGVRLSDVLLETSE